MEKAICRNCGAAIVLLIDRWLHTATGNAPCANGQTEAGPN